MQPNKKVIINGQAPSEGGEIEVNHTQSPLPGQTIAPSALNFDEPKPNDYSLTPFSQQLQDDTIDLSQIDINEVADKDLPTKANGQEVNNISTNDYNNNLGNKSADNVNSFNISPNNSNGMYSTNPNMANISPINQPEANQEALTKTNINNIKSKKNIKPKILIFIILPLLLVAGLAGFYFGYYLPNTPQNVWNTGLKRTGLQAGAVVNKLSDKKALLAYEKTALKVTGNYELNGQNISLNIDSNLDSVNSDTKSSIKVDDKVNTLNVEALFKTQLPEGANLPNMYFKVSGFKNLGLDTFLPGINNYDNKWVSLEQDFYNSLADNSKINTSTKLNYQDVTSVLKDVNTVTNDYLFNPDPKNSILILKQFVGTEESEGIKANHYKAGINSQNLTNWCNALVNKLSTNQGLKNLYAKNTDELNQALEQQKQNCQTIDKDIKADDEFDIWIDKNIKIFHKIRIYQELNSNKNSVDELKKQASYDECLANNNGRKDACVNILEQPKASQQPSTNNYIDIGQVFKNRQQVKLFANQVTQNNNNSSNTRLDLNLNLDSLAFDGNVNSLVKSDGQETKLQITIKTEPYNGQIDSTKPNGAVPIQQLFKQVLGTENPFAQTKDNAKDSKRKSDITSLYYGIEEYYVKNKSYPSYGQINDSQFRRQNLSGVKENYFSDPNAPNSQLANRLGANVYSYVTIPANCDGKNRPCTYYELSATLQDGSVYTKKAIN